MILDVRNPEPVRLPSGRIAMAHTIQPLDQHGQPIDFVISVDTAAMTAVVVDAKDWRIERTVSAAEWTWRCLGESGAWDALREVAR